MDIDFFESSLGRPFENLKDYLSNSRSDVTVFCPYINTNIIKDIYDKSFSQMTIVTSWNMKDLWFGSSNINLYEFTKDNNINLLINNRIHLKVVLLNWEKMFFGSSNITERGLGVSSRFNYELNGFTSLIPIETKIYLRKILDESTLVNDEVYQRFKASISNLPELPVLPDVDIDQALFFDKKFFISSLPMSTSVNDFFYIYSSDFKVGTPEEINCALHDVVLFGLPLGLGTDQFNKQLQLQFFKNDFIKGLLAFIDMKPRYFGEMKEWIHCTCHDYPVPSRRDLTGNIQVLYKWITVLSDGQYLIDQPNYSERIFKV